MVSPRNISTQAAWFTVAYDMLLNYWYPARLWDTGFVFWANKATWEKAIMREQRLNCGGVRLLGSEFCPQQERLQIIWTDHSCKKEEKIGALMKFLQQMANCPSILWWGKRKKKHTHTKLSKNILYECITQTPFTPRTHRELSKRHSDKLFNRKWQKRIRERNFFHLNLKQQPTPYPRVNLWVQMVAQQNFSKHLER